MFTFSKLQASQVLANVQMPTQQQMVQMLQQNFSTEAKPLSLKKMSLSLKKTEVKLPFQKDKNYDVCVIGGGTGGLTLAQEARKLGLSVAIFDYVTPSPQGSVWGLGGTCVNVGCIPKKLFHIGTQVEESTHMLADYGWKGADGLALKHDWSVLRSNIQNHIKGINFSYQAKVKEIGADYINAFASFDNANEVRFTHGAENTPYTLKAKHFVIAAGNRPRGYPGQPELTEYAVTSDDLFSLEEDPGKTLVVGGGFVAVECAGFLRGLGKEVIMINRSQFLRTMDDDMTFRIIDDMEANGVQVLTKTVPTGAKKLSDKSFEVELMTDGEKRKVEVNTILLAIGRSCQPDKLGLANAGVEVAPSQRVQGRRGELERSSIDHIYAIGDACEGAPELMPVAQKSGKLLAHRIYERMKGERSEQEILDMYSADFSFIPSTVFSPTEYSFAGLNEQEAILEFGEENIEVYHREVTPLQFSIVKGNTKNSYMKVICHHVDNGERVVGMHFFGPSADEVIAGYAVAMKLGLKKEHLDGSVGVHPSTSEEFFNMEVTKRSGVDYSKTDC